MTWRLRVKKRPETSTVDRPIRGIRAPHIHAQLQKLSRNPQIYLRSLRFAVPNIANAAEQHKWYVVISPAMRRLIQVEKAPYEQHLRPAAPSAFAVRLKSDACVDKIAPRLIKDL